MLRHTFTVHQNLEDNVALCTCLNGESRIGRIHFLNGCRGFAAEIEPYRGLRFVLDRIDGQPTDNGAEYAARDTPLRITRSSESNEAEIVFHTDIFRDTGGSGEF